MVTDPQQFCRTITLTDEPEESDAFSGPHQRIAQAVAGLIQPPDAKGIAIGIEGSWGSGKSTVARMLIKKLEADKDNIAVVNFDAWAHEGDPLRRTFLETLIRALQALPGWVNAEKWEGRIEQLANRREVVTTKDNLSVTGWGKLAAFTLLLVPLGSALVSVALRENTLLSGGPSARKYLFILLGGLLLTFAPLIVLAVRRKKQQDILGLLFNKGPTERTTETSRTANPTSIEFEETFKELIAEALEGKQKQKRRIVLILDNLDRVDPQDALSIWSTLQTFFQHKGSSQLSWRDRLWLIVLYDIRGLSQLWENEGGAKTALSFIDKSFQIRFEVPALVPSDWRQFLMAQLQEALPDHTEAELHEVYRVLAVWVAEKNRVPTIRELKLFVNQIGGVHRQWAGTDHTRDTYPLAFIAYYVLLRRDGVDVVQSLFDENFPRKEYLDILGSRVHEQLAALAFNVEVDVAQQLLFSDKIQNALTLGSAEELTRVASLLPRGFWEVFERIAREWASAESIKIPNAARALQKSGILTSGYGPTVRIVTQCFCERAATVQAWAPLDPDRANGLAVLLNWNSSFRTVAEHDKFIQTLFRAIALGLIHSDSVLPPRDWLECVNNIVEGLDPTTRRISVKIIVNTLSNRLREHGPLVSGHQESVLEVLSELSESSEISSAVQESLRDLVDSKTLEVQFVNDQEKSPRTVAWMVYIMMRYGSSFEGLPRQGRSEVELGEWLKGIFNPPMVQAFVEILERYKQIPHLFSLLRIAPEYKQPVVDSLRIALNSSDAKDLFTGKDAFDRLEFVFNELVESDKENLLERLFSDVQPQLDLIEGLKHRALKEANANLYLLILKTSNGRQKELANQCVTLLRAVSSDVWRSNIYLGKSLFTLALYLNEIGTEVHLGENYYLGLKKLMEISNDKPWDPGLTEGVNIAALIGPPESQFRHAFQDYLETYIKNVPKLPSWLFPVFGYELAELLHSSHGVHVLSLFEVIVNSENLSGLKWLRDMLAEALTEVQSKYRNELPWKDFKVAIRRRLTDPLGSKERYELIESIASILNVKAPANGLITFADFDKRAIYGVDPKDGEEIVRIEEPALGYSKVSQPSWLPDGKKLAYCAETSLGRSNIFVFDASSGESSQVTHNTKASLQPSWFPDDQALAFVKQDGPISDIYIIDLPTKKELRLTQNSGRSEHPTWSPDGTRIAFHRVDEKSVSKILVVNVDGSNEKAITEGRYDYFPVWSPSGRKIAFYRESTTDNGIHLISPEGGATSLLVEEYKVHGLAWSPDGAKLLYQVGQDADAMIYQVDAAGQNKTEIAQGITPAWQPLISDESATST